jgi:hypothetical protein
MQKFDNFKGGITLISLGSDAFYNSSSQQLGHVTHHYPPLFEGSSLPSFPFFFFSLSPYYSLEKTLIEFDIMFVL